MELEAKSPTCRVCHRPLIKGAPERLCPVCLFDRALEPDCEIQDAAPVFPKAFKDYELLEEIARGGMGIVFRARQRNPNRIVALKIILAGAFADNEAKRRFEWEAEAIARLSHENIVQIYESGVEDGFPFFSMEFVSGGSLEKPENRQRFSTPTAIASCVKDLALALQHAHSRRVIHRDLKPSNILLDQDGNAFVSDFGLSVGTDNQSRFTMTGRVLGSLGYIAPEQLQGDIEVSTALDIYSLGAILYFLLTGEPPAKSFKESLNSDPKPPRELNNSVPRDLETICLKCLEKKPGLRYRSGAALADDLGRFLGKFPVTARPVGRMGRAWRFVERRPVVSAVVVCCIFLSAAALTFGFAKWAASLKSHRDLQELAIELSLREANSHYDQGNLRDGAARLLSTLRRFPGDNRAAWRLRSALHYRRHLLLTNQLSIGSENIRVACFSPTGSEIALASQSGTVSLQRLNGTKIGELKIRLGTNDSVAGMEFSPRGMATLVISAQGKAFHVDFDRRRSTQIGGLDSQYRNVTLSHDGRFVAAKTPEGVVSVWDSKDLNNGIWSTTTRAEAQDLILDPAGKKILLVSQTDEILVKNLETGEGLDTIHPNIDSIRSLSLSPDGSLLAVMGASQVNITRLGSGEKILAVVSTNLLKQVGFSSDSRYLFDGGVNSCDVWDMSSGKHLWGHVESDLFTPSEPFVRGDSLLATVSDSREFRLWDFREPLKSFDPIVEDWIIEDAVLSPTGNYFATVTGFTNVNLWTIPRLDPPVELTRHGGRVKTLKFSSNDDILLTAASDGSATLRRVPRLTEKVHSFSLSGITSASLTSDNKRLAIGTGNGAVSLFDRVSGKQLKSLTNLESSIELVAFARSGEVLASATEDDNLRFHDGNTGEVIAERNLRDDLPIGAWLKRIFEIEVRDKDNLLGIACGNGSAQLWDTRTFKRKHLIPHPAPVTSINFSQSGDIFVTGCMDGFARVWNTESGALRAAPLYHRLEVTTARISPDGNRLLTTSYDRRARIWDLSTGFVLHQTEAQPDRLICGEFSPDGSLFVTGSTDGSVVLWDSKTAVAVSERFRHASSVSRLGFSHDGKFLAAGFWDGLVELLKIDTAPLSPSEEREIGMQYFPVTTFRALSIGGLPTLRSNH